MIVQTKSFNMFLTNVSFSFFHDLCKTEKFISNWNGKLKKHFYFDIIDFWFFKSEVYQTKGQNKSDMTIVCSPT